MKINTIIKKQIASSLAKAQEKYADDMASGEMIVEPQTEKSVYSKILWLIFAILVVIICEVYVFDKHAQLTESCDLFLSVSPSYWSVIGMSLFLVFSLFYMLFTFWRYYKELLKNGYALDKQSSIFVKVLKKQNPTTAKLKVLFTTVLFGFLIVFTVYSVNDLFTDKTNQKIASYELIKKKSQAMQHNCLAKIK